MIAPVDNDQFYQQQSRFSRGYEYVEKQTEDVVDRQLVDTAREAIGRHPVVAITVASIIGITAGWLIKRRMK